MNLKLANKDRTLIQLPKISRTLIYFNYLDTSLGGESAAPLCVWGGFALLDHKYALIPKSSAGDILRLYINAPFS